VFTTYDVVSAEFAASNGKKKGKGKAGNLLETKWKRVVLDEGHTIRNPKAAKTRLVRIAMTVSKESCAELKPLQGLRGTHRLVPMDRIWYSYRQWRKRPGIVAHFPARLQTTG
jgi:hypothetical protein